jgi:serine/threonine protein phosphatase PrpC
MPLKYSFARVCRIGARPVNQDRVGHWASAEALLTVVADGMGGHPRGELAAQIAVEQLGSEFAVRARPRLERPATFLLDAFRSVHRAITREARELKLVNPPRTVLAACVLQDGAATWLHVGDARFYLLRRGRVVLRSRDDSFIQRLIDTGRLDEESAVYHPDRNIVLKCLGGDEALRLRRPARVVLEPNDVVMLCSDGFWGPLRSEEIAQGLRGDDLQPELDALVSCAEARTGVQCDNVSVAAIALKERARRTRRGQSAKPADNFPTET